MNEWSNLRQMLTLLKKAGMRPAYFIVPGLISAIAAAFEGLSVVLLVPIVQGLFNKDFTFVKTAPYLSDVIARLPASWTATDHDVLVLILGLFIASVILKNLCRYASMMTMSFLAYRTAHHLRKQIFSHYLGFGKLFFDRSTIGHHSTVLSNFTELAMNPVIGVDRSINQVFSIIAYAFVLCSISWKLTLVAVPLFVLLHFSVTFVIKKIRKISAQIALASKSVQKKSLETLSTIPLVIAYNAQETEKEKYKTLSDDLSKSWFRSSIFNNLINPMNELETLIAMIAVVAVIFFLLPGENIAPSALVVYFYLVMNAAIKFSTLTTFRSQIATASGPVSEILKVFEGKDTFVVPSGADTFGGLKDKIEFRNFHYAYPGGRKVLTDISFDIKKGAMTAIVGPTGSGKTTLVNILLRYYDCDPNMLFVDGKDIRDYTLESLRSHMAIVSQDTLLFNDTIRNNIAYGLKNVSDERVRQAIDEASLTEFIAKLPKGLDTLVGDRGVQLSGGEKQRVSIARALLKGADILILDEATSSLDSQTEALIQEAIDRVTKGKTSIVIAHRLSTIKHAEKIVVIDHGKCTEQGTLDELIAKKGTFHSFWESQKFS